jgi:predicted Zn-dependent protease
MRGTLVAAILLLTGCQEIIPAPRGEPYEFRHFADAGPDAPADTLSFHWPREYAPVRVWVNPTSRLHQHLAPAIRAWEEALLYGEWRGQIVSDSASAEIVVVNAPPPAGGGGGVSLGSMAPQCRGEFTFYADIVTREVELPVFVYVWSRVLETDPALDSCYRTTLIHEIGHAIGIFAHSGDIRDIMYSDPVADRISDRDRATAELVHHRIPTLHPAPRR